MNKKSKTLPTSAIDKTIAMLEVFKECFDMNVKEIAYKNKGSEKPAFGLDVRPTRITSAVTGTDIKDVDGFLYKLKNEGVILDIKEGRAKSDGAFFYVIILPKDFIEKYKQFRAKFSEHLKSDKPDASNEKIKKIIIIKMNDGKKLVAINDNLTETKEIKDYSEWWQIFIREIEERNIRPETRSDVKEISKDMLDYFKYNIQKCPIYMSGKYKPTEIFIGRGDDATLNPDIKTKIMTERQYLARKGRK